MKRVFSIAVILLLLFPLCWAADSEKKQTKTKAQTKTSLSPFFTGDGGKGKSIAILAPRTTGLTANQSYLPVLAQGEFVSNFSNYSAITVLDRQRLDEQYAELLSGYYDDKAQASWDLGHQPPRTISWAAA